MRGAVPSRLPVAPRALSKVKSEGGAVNIWSKYEEDKRRARALEDREDKSLSRYLRSTPTPLMTEAEIAQARERAEGEARRYATLQLTLRSVHPEWTADAVRAEALRLIRLERPGFEPAISYLPKAGEEL